MYHFSSPAANPEEKVTKDHEEDEVEEESSAPMISTSLPHSVSMLDDGYDTALHEVTQESDEERSLVAKESPSNTEEESPVFHTTR